MSSTDVKSRLESFNCYYFDKDVTQKFISFLMKKGDVIAPHKTGELSYKYEIVSDATEVVLNYSRTILPLKKAFMPPRETLINFNIKNNQYTKPQISTEPKIFFGIHSYEMQSIKRLDYSFITGLPESNYLTRRENCKFIGVAYKPDEWHFAGSVGIDINETDGFCLYFYPAKNGYIVFEITDEGKNLLDEFGEGSEVTDEYLKLNEDKFQAKIKFHHNRIPEIFTHVYNSKVWEDVAQKCVGCGTCNLLCSTCYCYDVHDEIELDVENGQRDRFWDGCMLNKFAEVAGGENFRDNLGSRNRHRLYRKFKYITNQSDKLHCVGCGRCSRYCPANISLVEIVNDLIDDYTKQQQKEIL
ncbi:MAG: 4Fe-4S dicluster domain-containing protein [Melioribacteraceae bacterium]|nr:4Fe-4S dicluster domain-containing protein [Melioribacteraceae bacterium]